MCHFHSLHCIDAELFSVSAPLALQCLTVSTDVLLPLLVILPSFRFPFPSAANRLLLHLPTYNWSSPLPAAHLPAELNGRVT